MRSSSSFFILKNGTPYIAFGIEREFVTLPELRAMPSVDL